MTQIQTSVDGPPSASARDAPARETSPAPPFLTSSSPAGSELSSCSSNTSKTVGSIPSSPPAPSSVAATPEESTTLPVEASIRAAAERTYRAAMKTARPYRSHKYPACARCHKRRSRCTIEVPGQACLLCRMHGVPCSSATASQKDDRGSARVGFVHRSLLADGQGLEGFSHIVGPVIARDTQILDRYLPRGRDGGDRQPPQTPDGGPNPVQQPANHDNNDNHVRRRESNQKQPIYHVPVPPRRPSPTTTDVHGGRRDLPGELLEQVEPYVEPLLAHYYENFHPGYPVTDEECVLSRLKERGSLPQTFYVNLVAHALFYWDSSPACLTARPDQDLAWQTAVAANMADMQKGDLATVVATCLDVAGRPSRCLVNNVTNVARAVALSHAIGLNHDCGEWKLGDVEKRLRLKAWWGVVVQDRWFNFAQGTPPYISKGHYDVPLPTVELLLQGTGRAGSVKHVRAAQVFVHLCRLTEIVGDVLPLIYHIRSGNDGIAAEQTSRSEIELNRWTESRPNWLDLTDFGPNRLAVPGLLNLQLSYLSVRMLLRRIAWHEISQRESDPASSWLLGCQAAAEDIVRFVASLDQTDMMGFWLPYNAHHFTSAVTLLLRCALQTSHAHVRAQCMASARTLVDCLKRYHQDHRWDLAEAALSQSETVLKRIEDSLPRTPLTRTPVLSTVGMQNGTNGTNGVATPRPSYLDDSMLGEPLAEEAFLVQQGQGSIEELFPEIFSDFTDTALFPGSAYVDLHG